MDTARLVQIRTESERGLAAEIRLTPDQIRNRDSSPYFESVLPGGGAGEFYTEGNIPILQQLLIHPCVRLPIRSVSEERFRELHGLDIVVAERLVELGFLIPVLTHRAQENWSEDHPHLEPLIRNSVSAGDRFEAFLGQICLASGIDYGGVEHRSSLLIGRYVSENGLNEMIPYEQPWSEVSGRNSSVKRLAWLMVLYPDEAEALAGRISLSERNSLTHLRLMYHHLIAPQQAALGGTLVADENVRAAHRAGLVAMDEPGKSLPELPKTMRALQAALGGEATWPPLHARYLQDRRGQNRVVDWLEKNRNGNFDNVSNDLRAAIEANASWVMQGRLEDAAVAEVIRNRERVLHELARQEKRLEKEVKVAFGISSLIVLAVAKQLGIVQFTFALAGEKIGWEVIPDWVAGILIRANNARAKPTTQLIRAISAAEVRS